MYSNHGLHGARRLLAGYHALCAEKPLDHHRGNPALSARLDHHGRAGAYAYGRRKHLSINMLTKKLSPRGQKILDIGVQLVVIAFCVVVMILGDLRLVETTFNQISSALHLPMPYVYASILVGGVLIVFYAVIFILEDLKAIRQAGDEIPAAKQ